MYTIYYVFLIVIIVSFVTGIILNIIENKNKSINTNSVDNTKIVSDKTTNPEVEELLSNTISYSTPIIISSKVISEKQDSKVLLPIMDDEILWLD